MNHLPCYSRFLLAGTLLFLLILACTFSPIATPAYPSPINSASTVYPPPRFTPPVSTPLPIYTRTPLPTETPLPTNVIGLTQLAQWSKGLALDTVWSDDGHLLVVQGSLGAYIYDAQTLEELRLIEAGFVSTLAFRPRSHILITGTQNGIIQEWDADTGMLEYTYQSEKAVAMYDVVVSPDDTIMTTIVGWEVRTWNLETNQRLYTYPVDLETHQLAFSPDGKEIILKNLNDLSVLDARTGTEVRIIPDSGGLPNHKGLRVVPVDGGVEVRDFQTNTYISTLIVERPHLIAFHPNGTMMATTNADSTRVTFWDMTTGKQLRVLEANFRWISRLTFSPDGEQLAILDTDQIIFWGTNNQKVGQVTGFSASVISVAFSPDNKTLAIGTLDGQLHFWDYETNSLTPPITGFIRGVTRLTFHPEGFLAIQDGIGNLTFLNHANGETTFTFPAPPYQAFAFSRDYTLLAIGGQDGRIEFWNPTSRSLLKTWQASSSAITVLTFSGDGQFIASVDRNGFPQIWDVATGTQFLALENLEILGRLLFSPTSQTLAMQTTSRVWLWDLTTRQNLFDLPAGLAVNSLVFSPNGKYIATGDWIGLLQIWNVSTGELLATVSNHTGPIYDLVFSSDGKLVATGSNDGSVRVWKIGD